VLASAAGRAGLGSIFLGEEVAPNLSLEFNIDGNAAAALPLSLCNTFQTLL